MQQRQSCPSGCGSTCPGRGFLKPAGGGFRPRRAGGPAHPQTTNGCGLPSNMRNKTEREATSTCQLHSVKNYFFSSVLAPLAKAAKSVLGAGAGGLFFAGLGLALVEATVLGFP